MSDYLYTPPYSDDATRLEAAMQAKMWNASASMFCDGICSEQPHTGVTTNSWALFNDIVPSEAIPTAWAQAAAYGLEGFGDYGAFIWISAQNKYAGDDGSAMLHALTKCDRFSW